jgi:hypothetical protein
MTIWIHLGLSGYPRPIGGQRSHVPRLKPGHSLLSSLRISPSMVGLPGASAMEGQADRRNCRRATGAEPAAGGTPRQGYLGMTQTQALEVRCGMENVNEWLVRCDGTHVSTSR